MSFHFLTFRPVVEILIGQTITPEAESTDTIDNVRSGAFQIHGNIAHINGKVQDKVFL